MDGLGEVIIGNKIYSARYAQPPRVVQERREDEDDGAGRMETVTHKSWSGAVPTTDATVYDDATGAVSRADDCCWLPPVRPKGTLITTDLDELPVVGEPDYINLRVGGGDPTSVSGDETTMAPILSKISAGRKIFTNTYGREENIYEEINELQRRLALEQQSVSIATRGQQQHWASPGLHHHHHRTDRATSLVDEVMDEVARVRLGHDKVLNQLNLDLEHFLKPQTPEPSPPLPQLEQQQQNLFPQDFEPIGKDRSSQCTGEVLTPVLFSTPPTGRAPRKFISHNRSNSSVTFTMSQFIGAGERSLVRCESLDFCAHDVGLHRRPSVISRGSTSTSSSVSSSNRSDTRQSIRNLHQGLQHGIQGLADWTEKCGHMLAKRSKKVIAFVNKGKFTV